MKHVFSLYIVCSEVHLQIIDIIVVNLGGNFSSRRI